MKCSHTLPQRGLLYVQSRMYIYIYRTGCANPAEDMKEIQYISKKQIRLEERED